MNAIPSPVLRIVPCRDDAIREGANPVTKRHRRSPSVIFYWPQTDAEYLRGMRFDYLFVDRDAHLSDFQRSWLIANCTRSDTVLIGPYYAADQFIFVGGGAS